MADKIDIEAKRAEVAQLYDDLLSIVQDIVAAVKAGKKELKASMLQQVNAFLRESALMLQRLEEINEKEAMRRQYERTVAKPLNYSDDPYIPFPVTDGDGEELKLN